MRPLVVIFHQPALCNFPYFIQCSEQVKIQDFCPVCPVEPFDKSILCRLPRLDKFGHHPVFFGPSCQRQRDQFWPAFSAGSRGLPRPVQPPDDSLSRDIQVDFYRQCFTVKIIHHIEGPESSAADHGLVHKIDGPALV